MLKNMKAFLSQHDLVYEVAPLGWDQGLPLGNGDLGGMIWGDGMPLRITLDKMDAWDLRRSQNTGPGYNYQTLRRLIEERQFAAGQKLFSTIGEAKGPYPTRVYIGRMHLEFGSQPIGFEGRLSLHDAKAMGTVLLEDGKASFSCFIPAQKNLLVLELHLEGEARLRYQPELYCRLNLMRALDEESTTTLKRWGYPEPFTGSEGALAWHLQPIPENGGYCVIWTLRQDATDHVVLLLSVALCTDGDPLSAARAQLEDALRLGPEKLYQEHALWWEAFWDKSTLMIPDARLENLYYVGLYKLACNSSAKLPPTYQGLWTSDGELASQGFSDYHPDLNVQETYWPVYASNHLELGKPLYDMFSAMLPRLRRFCQDFYGLDGAMATGSLAYNGPRPLGWWTTGYWTGGGPWVAHHYWLHYLYSQDEAFLREKAYPFMREFMSFYAGFLEKGEGGLYHLPWDNSPEWESNRGEAWGWDVTCSLALVRFLAQALLRCQEILNISDPDAPKWQEILDRLAPYPQDQTGLLIMKDTPLSHSHRHYSHLMPIHPLGLLTIEGSEEEKDLIERSINTWLRRGFGEWNGEGWPWASLIASRIRRGNMAWKFLQLYMDGFISENTLNVNGDFREYGLGSFLPTELSSGRWGKAFSINGGFAAAAGVLEMLLQSWNGIIRVFPAIPDHWRDAYFQNLRAEGAFLVTSRLANGKVAFVDIVSEMGAKCRVRNPWLLRTTLTGLSDGESRSLGGDILEFPTRKGDSYRLTPEGAQVDARHSAPPAYERKPDELNWFGVKVKPRV